MQSGQLCRKKAWDGVCGSASDFSHYRVALPDLLGPIQLVGFATTTTTNAANPLRRQRPLSRFECVDSMSYAPEEQAVHDRINLLRLVKRLEKSVESEEWKEDTRIPSRAAWINTQGVLQVCGMTMFISESLL